MIDLEKGQLYNELEQISGNKRQSIQAWFCLKNKNVLNPIHYQDFLNRVPQGRPFQTINK